MSTILVTGATGNIGSRVARALSSVPGVRVRAAVRDPAKAVGLPAAVERAPFDWADPDGQRAALVGVDALFLLTPLTPDQVEVATRLVALAREAGVRRVVKLSALGADSEPGIQLGRWHRAVERAIEASGLEWTFLRPNNFADNFATYYPPDAEGAIYLPFGDGAVSWIDARDIADVAARVLTTDGHVGKAYTLTGPEALGVAAVARVLSEVTGRAIRYVDVPESAARDAMLGAGAPAWMVDAMLELHAIDKAGWAAAVTDDVERVLGRPPRTFRAWAEATVSRASR